MRLHGFLIGQAETLLADVLRFSGPADAELQHTLRVHWRREGIGFVEEDHFPERLFYLPCAASSFVAQRR